MIAQSTVDRIFDAALIEEVIGEFVHLKKAGANYKGLSPWTNEKTPSFFVSPSKGIFKDFSSGKGGNVVTFLMELEQMTYPEALKFLADKYQIEVEETGVTPEELQEKNVRETLALVNQFALECFRDNLWDSEAGRSIGLSYFRERGYTDGTIKKFELGYALDESDAFLKSAEASGHKRENLVQVGLVKEGKYGVYDFFRGRVIFPIRNISGRSIAFAGRTLRSDDKVKYINSPENELYDKSATLYGLYESKQGISRHDNCLLVEGYTDVISLHQAGVDYAVASAGTSLTPRQAKLIKRYTKNVSILYDGDSAGVKAAMRGIDILLAEGLNVRVVHFPEGHDPDSFSRSVSQTELTDYLSDNAKDFTQFILDVLLPDGQNDPIAKSEATRRVLESLSMIEDPIVRNFYIEQCGDRLRVPERAMVSELNKIIRKRQLRQNRERHSYEPETQPENLPMEAGVQVADPELVEKEVTRVMLRYGRDQFDLEVEPEEPEETTEQGLDIDDLEGLETQLPQKPNTVRVRVAEYILHDLEVDNINFHSEVCANIVAEFRRRFAETGSFPEAKDFTRDDKLNVAVADLVSDPHHLSENWAAKHRIYTETEEEDLRKTVFDPLMRFKLRKIKDLIDENEAALKAADRDVDFDALLMEKMTLNRMKSEVCAFFGTTIL